MLRFFYPQINKTDILPIFKIAIFGAIIASFYGILHDQITYSISPEYFTKVKFKQFHYIDFGFNKRVTVSIIGFLASGAVGLIAGWFLGRWYLPNHEIKTALKNIKKGIILILLFSLFCSSCAFYFGIMINPNPHLEFWSNTFDFYEISDGWSFVRVAYIHYGSYAGGLTGLICTFIFIKPTKSLAS